MDDSNLDKKRSCRACPKVFQIKRINQFYCSAKCRHREKERRKEERRRTVAKAASGIDLHRLIVEMQTERDKSYIPRLQREPYLMARAAVIEAEAQLNWWQKQLKQRQEALSKMSDPRLVRQFDLITENKPIQVPKNASWYGACSTDGHLGVIVFGSMVEERIKGS